MPAQPTRHLDEFLRLAATVRAWRRAHWPEGFDRRRFRFAEKPKLRAHGLAARDRILERLRDPALETEERELLMWGIGESGSPKLARLVLAECEGTDDQGSALHAAVVASATHFRERLIRAMSEPDEGSRIVAVQALWRWRDSSRHRARIRRVLAVTALDTAETDEVRKLAIQSLRHFGERPLARLLLRLTSEPGPVGHYARQVRDWHASTPRDASPRDGGGPERDPD